MKKYLRYVKYLAFLIAVPVLAGTTRIYVDNYAGTTIHVVNPATNKVVQVIEGIEEPQSSHFSPDGTRVYISNGADNVLEVVDRKTGKHIKRIPLSGYPNDLAVTNDGQRVLVCIRSLPGVLDIIDTKTLEKVMSIPVKSGLHDIFLPRDGKYAVADREEGKTVTVFDLQTNQVAWEVSFDSMVMPVTVESGPDGSGRRIFLQLRGMNGFAVVDFATRKEVARVQLPDTPNGFENCGGVPSHGIAVTPDGNTLWVNSCPANSVFVYSLSDLHLLGHVSLPELKLPGKASIGAAPNWITFTPDSRRAYITNRALRSVSAVDTETMKLLAVIPVGESPDRISTLVLP
jgi:YVTN family beta-propeller protein